MKLHCAVWVLVPLFAVGCATPTTMSRASARGLARTQLGMTEPEVRKAAGARGEPIFHVAADHEYECQKFVSKSNGVPYYYLWEDGKLSSVVSAENCLFIEKTRGVSPGSSHLPHEDGCDILLAPFSPPRAPDAYDFEAKTRGFQTRADRASQTRAELLMWSPIIIISLPFLPLSAAGEVYDDAATVAAYRRAYRIVPGMEESEMKAILGEPDYIVGDTSTYSVYTYHYRPADGEGMYISIGLREGRSAWVRFRYNAYAEYTGITDSGD